MNLFKDTYLFQEDGEDGDRAHKGKALNAPWQNVDIISSNCPVHIGVRLGKVGDNQFQCPKGKEIYKAKGSVSNQTNKDRYDTGIDIIKTAGANMNRMRKISIRDSSNNSAAVEPKEFNSDYLFGPHKINNIHIMVKNLYYLGYKDQSSVIEQLKLRGMDADAEMKKAVKECLEDLVDREEQPPKK